MELTNEINNYCEICISFNTIKKTDHYLKGLVWKKNNPEKVKAHQKHRNEKLKEAKRTPEHIIAHKLHIEDTGCCYRIKYMKNGKRIETKRRYGKRNSKEEAFNEITKVRSQLMKKIFNIDL